jgi:hypothetical protein
MSNAKETDRLKALENLVEDIDAMCQTQLGQIEAVTNVMLRAMETPEFWKRPTTIRETIGLIQYLAADLGNYVNGAAETLGCNSVDHIERERESRVFAAFRANEKQEVDHV